MDDRAVGRRLERRRKRGRAVLVGVVGELARAAHGYVNVARRDAEGVRTYRGGFATRAVLHRKRHGVRSDRHRNDQRREIGSAPHRRRAVLIRQRPRVNESVEVGTHHQRLERNRIRTKRTRRLDVKTAGERGRGELVAAHVRRDALRAVLAVEIVHPIHPLEILRRIDRAGEPEVEVISVRVDERRICRDVARTGHRRRRAGARRRVGYTRIGSPVGDTAVVGVVPDDAVADDAAASVNINTLRLGRDAVEVSRNRAVLHDARLELNTCRAVGVVMSLRTVRDKAVAENRIRALERDMRRAGRVDARRAPSEDAVFDETRRLDEGIVPVRVITARRVGRVMSQKRVPHDTAVVEKHAAATIAGAVNRPAVRDDAAVDKTRPFQPDATREVAVARRAVGVRSSDVLVVIRRNREVVEPRVGMRQLEDRAVRTSIGRQLGHAFDDSLRSGIRTRDRRAAGERDLRRYLVGAVCQQDVAVRVLLERRSDRRQRIAPRGAAIRVAAVLTVHVHNRQEARLEAVRAIANGEPELHRLVPLGRNVACPPAEPVARGGRLRDARLLARLDPLLVHRGRAVAGGGHGDPVLDLPLPFELMPESVVVRKGIARPFARAHESTRVSHRVDGVELPARAGRALVVRNLNSLGWCRAGQRPALFDSVLAVSRRKPVSGGILRRT